MAEFMGYTATIRAVNERRLRAIQVECQAREKQGGRVKSLQVRPCRFLLKEADIHRRQNRVSLLQCRGQLRALFRNVASRMSNKLYFVQPLETDYQLLRLIPFAPAAHDVVRRGLPI